MNEITSRIEALAEKVQAPVGMTLSDPHTDIADQQRKQAAHEAYMARTVGDELKERIERLTEQLDTAWKIKHELDDLGLSGLRMSSLRSVFGMIY